MLFPDTRGVCQLQIAQLTGLEEIPSSPPWVMLLDGRSVELFRASSGNMAVKGDAFHSWLLLLKVTEGHCCKLKISASGASQKCGMNIFAA